MSTHDEIILSFFCSLVTFSDSCDCHNCIDIYHVLGVLLYSKTKQVLFLMAVIRKTDKLDFDTVGKLVKFVSQPSESKRKSACFLALKLSYNCLDFDKNALLRERQPS